MRLHWHGLQDRLQYSGVARVIVFGGASCEPQRHSRGSAPNFYTDLDFWNGLEHNSGGGRPRPSPLNYATATVTSGLKFFFNLPWASEIWPWSITQAVLPATKAKSKLCKPCAPAG